MKKASFRQESLEALDQRCAGTLVDYLGIKFTAITTDELVAEMRVSKHLQRPGGILHGGGTAALVETVASVAGLLLIKAEEEVAVGTEISVNHLRMVPVGEKVSAHARVLHNGRKSKLLLVDVFNSEKELVALGKLSMMVLSRQNLF